MKIFDSQYFTLDSRTIGFRIFSEHSQHKKLTFRDDDYILQQKDFPSYQLFNILSRIAHILRQLYHTFSRDTSNYISAELFQSSKTPQPRVGSGGARISLKLSLLYSSLSLSNYLHLLIQHYPILDANKYYPKQVINKFIQLNK